MFRSAVLAVPAEFWILVPKFGNCFIFEYGLAELFEAFKRMSFISSSIIVRDQCASLSITCFIDFQTAFETLVINTAL